MIGLQVDIFPHSGIGARSSAFLYRGLRTTPKYSVDLTEKVEHLKFLEGNTDS